MGWMLFQKSIKDFSLYLTSPLLWPHPIPGIIIWTNLSLHLVYMRSFPYKIWAFLAKWHLRRFLKSFNKLSFILNYLPYKEGVAIHLNKLEYPSLSDVFKPSSGELKIQWIINFYFWLNILPWIYFFQVFI